VFVSCISVSKASLSLRIVFPSATRSASHTRKNHCIVPPFVDVWWLFLWQNESF